MWAATASVQVAASVACSMQHRARALAIDNASGAPLKVLGICGSLRKASVNRKLLKLAEKTMPEGSVLEIARIDDLPLMNTDLEEKGEGGATVFPPPVERLRRQVAEADAIFFATPEYNYSVPAPLKNAIDWASRPLPSNEWSQKPTAIASIAGTFGAAFVDLLILQKPAFFWNQRGNEAPFGDDGQPSPEVQKRLAALMVALVDWTRRVQQ